LWSHLIASLRTVHDRAGERSLTTLTAGPTAISETALPLLVEELDDCPPVVVVLEDWHLVSSRVCDRTVTAFVEQAPGEVQVVVSTRSDPRLPIARLRAHGDLQELRARDLRLSSTEAATLLRDAGVRLRKVDVERLTERTEGWLAGLRLALIALREQEDPRLFVQEFSGDSRHVFDYLARDVLDRVDPKVRKFMIRSSVLDRLSAPLCDSVLERSDSTAMLAAIERSSLFLVPLDATGDEFRYHHLFGAVLQRELRTSDPDSMAGLHAQASLWYEEHEDIERAVDHAIASGDLSRASTLILVTAVQLLSVGRMATLDRWFELLSWPEAQADRQLAAMRALTARLNGRGRHEVERWLAVAESGPDFGPLPNGITSMRSCVAMVSSTYVSRGIGDAERSARLVLESEPLESPWRYAGLVPLGQALYFAGRPEEARAPLEQARALPGARGHVSTALGMAYLALIELAAGDAERAEHVARDALTLAEELGHGASPGAANPHLALGCALLQGTDLYGAIAHLERAAELAGEDDATYWHAHALLHVAAARHRSGDNDGAHEALTRARTELDELPDLGVLADLYERTAHALQQRSRREGFLGEQLSDAELRILRRLAEGLSISAVAHELWLSSNTVKSHRRSIYRKLGVHSRESLLAVASELGLTKAAASDVHSG
jgi:LuxR family maltose regulon positive regulatory protein